MCRGSYSLCPPVRKISTSDNNAIERQSLNSIVRTLKNISAYGLFYSAKRFNIDLHIYEHTHDIQTWAKRYRNVLCTDIPGIYYKASAEVSRPFIVPGTIDLSIDYSRYNSRETRSRLSIGFFRTTRERLSSKLNCLDNGSWIRSTSICQLDLFEPIFLTVRLGWNGLND